MTTIINAQLPEFKVQAYHNGGFTTVLAMPNTKPVVDDIIANQEI